MTRPGGAWVPDGRAKTIAADCEASLAALDGLPIDLYLIHAPDPRTPWRTSVRALARLVEQGLVRRVGVANVTRTQLDEALELAPIAAVQVALSPLDDRALRGGVLARCVELGLTLIAHSPLGGPRREGRAGPPPRAGADRRAPHDATAAQTALAWLLGLAPADGGDPRRAAPGERALGGAAAALALALGGDDRAALTAAFGGARPARRPSGTGAADSLGGAADSAGSGEVVIVMGIPGAGKSRLAADYVRRGYVRLNRDERGGSLRALAG